MPCFSMAPGIIEDRFGPNFISKHENVWEKILILGNPNNPTGRAISATELERLEEVCRETHTWLMLDECFQWFLDTRRECSFVEIC